MTAGIGDVDSLGSTDDFAFGDVQGLNTPPWNGRDVEVQTWKQQERALISQFHNKVLQEIKELSHDQTRHRSYKILDLKKDEVEEVALDTFIPLPPQIETETLFQNAFRMTLETLLQGTPGNTPQIAAGAPFQNLPALLKIFEQGGNTPSQNELIDLLATVGRAVLDTLPEIRASDPGAFQKPTSLLESLGAKDAYIDFLEALSEDIGELADSFPSPTEFLQIISILMGLVPTSPKEQDHFKAGKHNPPGSQHGRINTQPPHVNDPIKALDEAMKPLRTEWPSLLEAARSGQISQK